MATNAASLPRFPQPGWLSVLIVAGVRRLIGQAKRAGGKRLPSANQMEALRRKFAKD